MIRGFTVFSLLVLILGGFADAASTELFNDGWRFHLGRVEGAERPGFDDSGWRAVDLPHDWSIEDLPRVDDVSRLRVLKGTWQFHKGDDPAWSATGFDDSGWQQVNLPAAWEEHSNHTEDNVYGWFRRSIVVPREMAGKDLYLDIGKADDVDRTYFNGVLVGGEGSFPPDYDTPWPLPRLYRVPEELIRFGEPNSIAVRLFDGNGPGGLREEAGSGERSGPFDSAAIGGVSTGFTLGGTGWYRKKFAVPAGWKDKVVRIEFDGVYMNADCWINGRHLGNHPYGYTAFGYDLTPHLHFGKDSVLAVEVKNEGRNTRWYSGSGIYRSVTISVAEPVHVAPWGVCVTTPGVSEEKAVVRVRATVRNAAGRRAQATVKVRIEDAAGKTVAAGETTKRVGAKDGEFDLILTVATPRVWSPEDPALYTVVSEVVVAGSVTDSARTPFGIRSISFDAKEGFRLNGKTVLLKGGCMHHDNGCLGAAAFPAAEERRVRKMKESGYNSIRTSHNPPSSAFLDACDRLGVMVIDEAFDHWERGKNSQDYHRYFEEWWEKDVVSMVLRDRNHPSVIMWSIGNEIPERGTEEGLSTARGLAARIRKLDPTRPVTEAVNGTKLWDKMDDYFANLDVAGYNYQQWAYVRDHEKFPDRIMYASESFPLYAFDYWMAVLDHPWVIGDFVWTGFDYLGEASIGWYSFDGGGWPWTVAYCGDIDICGFKRAQSYYRDVLWKTGEKLSILVHSPEPTFGERKSVLWGWDDVQASWTWPGREGERMKVDVYSRCEKVKLLLNGREIGEKETSRETRFIASWEVPYRPGALKAVGFTGGKGVAAAELKTAGKPARIRLTAERDSIAAGGQDLCYVVVEVLDAGGLRHPSATNGIRFRIDGAGTLAGVGNGNPVSVESFQRPRRSAFEGRALAVIRSGKEPGKVRLTAEADGLKPDSLTIAVE